MPVVCILEPIMKPNLSAGVFLLMLAPALGWAGDIRVHPLPSNAPATLLPITADTAEPRTAVRLRDALRQPHDDVEDDNKPYRMSVQERQRMREQLRSQSLYDPTKK